MTYYQRTYHGHVELIEISPRRVSRSHNVNLRVTEWTVALDLLQDMLGIYTERAIRTREE